jgi:hypothetical protein
LAVVGVLLAAAVLDRLRPVAPFPPAALPLALAVVVVAALAAGVGLALVLARVPRALGALVATGSITSSAGVSAVTAAVLARLGAGGALATFAPAVARGLIARFDSEDVEARVRWLSTRAHSSSERADGFEPWAWAIMAAFSISATRFCQEVAKRLSDWDLAPLSSRVSTTPSAVTFLRRRLKISF